MYQPRVVTTHPLADNLLLTRASEIRDDDDGRGVAQDAAYLLDLHGLGAVDGAEEAKLAVREVDALVEAVDSYNAIDFAPVEEVKVGEANLAVDSRKMEVFRLLNGVAEDHMAAMDTLENLPDERQLDGGEPLKALTTLMKPQVAEDGVVVALPVPLNETGELTIVLALGAAYSIRDTQFGILPAVLVVNDGETGRRKLSVLLLGIPETCGVDGIHLKRQEPQLRVGKDAGADGLLGGDPHNLNLGLAEIGENEITYLLLQGG